jgi:nitronate monooxygenase
MTPSQHLCSILAIDRPVLTAPMASISGGRLASAVTEAGGLGIIGSGYGDLAWLTTQVSLVDGAKFGVGVITWATHGAAFNAVLALEPAAIWLSFGDPGPYVGATHEAGAVAICQVGTLDEAVHAYDVGADVIVAQGREAGGHGRLSTPLLELVRRTTTEIPSIPIVAAGGITDRMDFDRVVDAGAAGVALGTALYATTEALDVDAAKRRLVAATGDDTVASTVYDLLRGPEWPRGYVGRSLRTSLTDRWAGREDELRHRIAPIAERYEAGAAAGDMTIRVVWAGEGVGKVDEIRPAAEIITRFPKIARNGY